MEECLAPPADTPLIRSAGLSLPSHALATHVMHEDHCGAKTARCAPCLFLSCAATVDIHMCSNY
jgi:hypothetical protein